MTWMFIFTHKVSLKEYIGNISYRGAELKSRGVEPSPGPADVRRLITEVQIFSFMIKNIFEYISL